MSDLSAQLDALKAKLDEVQASVAAAREESRQERQARISDVAAKAQSASEELESKAADASAEAKSRWAAFKANVEVKKDDLAARLEARSLEHDVKLAGRAADRAEDAAVDAIDFADLAIRNACLALLDAIDARLYADELVAQAGQSDDS